MLFWKIGAIPNTKKTLEEYRYEKLEKYENPAWHKCKTRCLLNRENFVQAAVNILKLPEKSVQKYISASAITDIYYIASQELRNKNQV